MTTQTTGRQASIDVLRAGAISLMVVVHFVENLSARFGGMQDAVGGVHRLWWLPTGFAAATFTVLSGISYRLWLESQLRKGKSEGVITTNSLYRAAFLFALGLVFNLVVWLPEGLFNWDVLTLIGFGLLTLEVTRHMPGPAIMLAVTIIVVLSPTLRVIAGYGEFWSSGSFEYDFTVRDIIFGWLATGYFPIFPWLAYPLIGFVVASWHRAGDRRLAIVGAIMALLSGVMVLAWPWLPAFLTGNRPRPWTMFPASTSYVFGTLGGVCLALSGTQRLLDGPTPRWQGLVAWATPLSRHALSLYILHHVVHVWPLWIYGYAVDGEPTAYWQEAMPLEAAIALAILFLAGAAVLCRLVDRWNLPTAESVMRQVCER